MDDKLRNLTNLTDRIICVNRQNGFYWFEQDIPKALCLIHSEVSEALAEHREPKEGWQDRFREELADIVIRTVDLAGQLGYDLTPTIINKVEKNAGRGHRHGKSY